ncbi:high affinity methionine permease [Pseudozyma hubeiensis SY62]|uniref:High affinity methionine permease n=1 Tax=Pseudozyma hubeiensis (strain SY62) TaxID=1305764 RepID=R9PEQ1_PSEHS|nr:high affinity methionine permease [Pseudozyma hubeiensis SY62]GAC99838.1 high affinity methionine permease [Pseudozyma hubeiensis SY62]
MRADRRTIRSAERQGAAAVRLDSAGNERRRSRACRTRRNHSGKLGQPQCARYEHVEMRAACIVVGSTSAKSERSEDVDLETAFEVLGGDTMVVQDQRRGRTARASSSSSQALSIRHALVSTSAIFVSTEDAFLVAVCLSHLFFLFSFPRCSERLSCRSFLQ